MCFSPGVCPLPQFVLRGGRLGILVVRHLKRLQRVIVGYLEVCDGPEEEARLGILQTLRCTIEHAWPRCCSGGERSLRKLILNVMSLPEPKLGLFEERAPKLLRKQLLALLLSWENLAQKLSWALVLLEQEKIR